MTIHVKLNKTSSNDVVLLFNVFSSGNMYVDEAINQNLKCFLVYLLTGDVATDKVIQQNVNKYNRKYKREQLEAILIKNDINEVLECIKNKNIIAVCPGHDTGVAMADAIAKKLNLNHNNPETTYKRLTKTGMHQACKDCGIRYIKTQKINNEKDIINFFTNNKLNKAFMKFDDGTSSIGAKLVGNIDEALKHYHYMLKLGDNVDGQKLTAIIQEYIEGIEYIVNCVSCAGKHYVTDIWKYEKADNGYGNIIYYKVELITEIDHKIKNLVDYCFDVLNSADFNYGLSHNEIKIDDQGPVIIEINPRCMGSGLTREFLNDLLGYCYVDLSLCAYTDQIDVFNNLYPNKDYVTLKNSCLKVGVCSQDTIGFLDSSYEIMKEMKTFFETYNFAPYGLHKFSYTKDFESATYCAKFSSDNDDDLNYDINLMYQLEKDFPKLMICESEDKLNIIKEAIQYIKNNDISKNNTIKDKIINNLPYGKEGFNFLLKVLRKS